MSEGIRRSQSSTLRKAFSTEEISAKVEKAREDLASLRKQQDSLEREKDDLESLMRQEVELERGKREVEQKLVRAIAILDAEGEESTRLLHLMEGTRESFQKILDEIQAIDEESWEAETLKDEIGRALVLIQRGRRELKKAEGKLEALSDRPPGSLGSVPPKSARGMDPLFSFPCLVKAGFALFLPAALLALLVLVLSRYVLS